MTKEEIDILLERVRSWPVEDQEQLAEVALEIEAGRAGVYALPDDDLAALEKSKHGPLATDDKVAAFWKRHGIK